MGFKRGCRRRGRRLEQYRHGVQARTPPATITDRDAGWSSLEDVGWSNLRDAGGSNLEDAGGSNVKDAGGSNVEGASGSNVKDAGGSNVEGASGSSLWLAREGLQTRTHQLSQAEKLLHRSQYNLRNKR